MEYEAVIGLEVHAQLKMHTKMFCACPTDFGSPPNTQVCPVCLGHPGALPMVNRRAVELGVRAGCALGAAVQRISNWARKNYFYPDLPKGYQITQFKYPLSEGGQITIESAGSKRRIGITRMHLEEDAGKSKHLDHEDEMRTLLDLNRCGTALLEIVSEPDLRRPEEAHAYLVELKQILQYCGVCDGDMEKGSLRCDANLSVRRKGSTELGVKTEIKNLNSFRNVKRALAVEFKRQVDSLERGETVNQATLLWDEMGGRTRLMRSKEDAHDYRYFPEPDLPPLTLDEGWIEGIRRGLPELPGARRERYEKGFGIRPYDAALLTATRELGDYFEIVASSVPDAQAAANFIGSALLGVLNERQIDIAQSPIAPEALADVLILQDKGTLSSSLAKQVLEKIIQTGKSATAIIREQGWEQVDDEGQLRQWAEGVIKAHPKQMEAYLGGKESLVDFFMGQIMQRSKGRAHPTKAQEVLLTILRKHKG